MSPATRHYWLYLEALIIISGVMFHKFACRNGIGEYLQFLVPRSMREIILYHMHEGLLSGHLGKQKTQERLLARCYWFGIRNDLDLWIDRCDNCAAIKKPPRPPKAPLGQMPVGAPMDRISTDILGPLPLTP